MRLLSFNLWHGLTPSSPLAFEALEPVARRELREQRQIDLLKELRPDLAFFQEVNPITQRAPDFHKQLGVNVAYQPDLVGVKLFGVGVPFNLNSGLLITSERGLGLKRLGGYSLSRPGTSWVSSLASWQLKEERFCVACEVMLPRFGRALILDTHIHHGLESTPDFEADMKKAMEELELSEDTVAELEMRLQAGTERRLREIENLLKIVSQLEARYETVIVCGDFNSSPGSKEWERMHTAGFHDLWQESPSGETPGFSYDGTVNRANHILQLRFPLTFVVEDLTFSPKVKDTLIELARRQEARPRRIDYIWMKRHTGQFKVQNARLVGLPDHEGIAPSDHFGVCVDVEAN